MSDFFVAIGLVLVIEGVLYALLPEAIRKMGRSIQDVPEAHLRWGGLFAALLGVALVWLIRHA
ncbi:DUF2065 domain-containing protein [Consotaella salsifontis]|uniref:DUF2065 domain-containing protein n=1 Tax=Consotaella salsifontis TaxID=1365950 RepID=A0A1T4RBM4_9HYPH|nr:DUF2065 domain-containing protein [Consotaella salsifontis]SKA13329.1 hypothetical protein SAMN05428963_106186 [Consotaella salsifontis]